MALNIFIGKENLPKEKSFVMDVCKFFGSSNLQDDAFTKKVLKEVEQGELLRDNLFQDRFGGGLYTSSLSTSTKILLSVAYYPEYVINGAELGTNCFDYLLEIKEGSVFFETTSISFHGFLENPVYCNGKLCYDVDELEDTLWKVSVV